jgi:DNA-binding SARP family transcriptional activator
MRHATLLRDMPGPLPPPPPPAPAAPRLALGAAPAVVAGGATHRLARQPAALLALVALAGPLDRARAAELLFPAQDSKAARRNLRQLVFRQRALLEPLLVDDATVLQLRGEVRVDLHEAGADDAPVALLGDLRFDDLPEFQQWLDRQRAQRRAAREELLAAAASAHEQAGRLAQALRVAVRLVAENPGSEHAHRRIMRLHFLRGDRAAALAAFDACESVLKDEFSARPGTETLALLRQIETAEPPRAAGPRPVPATVLRPPRLVGRGAAWAVLGAALERPAGGGAVLVAGEAGLGKTRLLRDFVHVHGADGAVVAVEARPGDQVVPYALLGRLLRALIDRHAGALDRAGAAALAPLLPELGAASSMRGEADRVAVSAAVATLVEGAAALGLAAIVVDDLHYADDASVEAIEQLAGAAPVGFVVAYRDAELSPAGRRLRDGLTGSRRAELLPLEPLVADEVFELLASLGIAGLDGPGVAELLHRRTGGSPLFLLEPVKALLGRDSGAAIDEALLRRLPLAGGVHALIGQRLQRLPADALRLARCAAVAGQDFGTALAAQVLQVRPIDLADAWGALEAAQVLRDGGFAHDLVREAALSSVPAPIARELHADVARSLEAAGGEAVRIALHWLDAALPQRAVPHLLAGGEQAFRRWRHVEAAELFEQAAQILERAGDRDRAFDALFRAADAVSETVIDERMAALADRLERLADDDGRRARAGLARFAVLVEAGRLDAAMDLAAQAVAQARRAGVVEIEAELEYGAAVVHWQRRDIDAALRSGERAHALYLQVDPARAELGVGFNPIKVTDALARFLGARGRFAESTQRLLETLAQATALGARTQILTTCLGLAHNAVVQGRLAQADEWVARAEDVVRSTEGTYSGERSYVLAQRAQVCSLSGELGRALEAYEALLELYRQVPLRDRGAGIAQAALFRASLGRRDLALQLLQALRDDASLASPQRLFADAAAAALRDGAAAPKLLERTAQLDDLTLRARCLALITPSCEPQRVLPLLDRTLAELDAGGAAGQWLTLAACRAVALRAAGQSGRAADAARAVWQRCESGLAPTGGLPQLAADLCGALGGTSPDLAQTIALRAMGWMHNAAASLPPLWRESYLARGPLRVQLHRGSAAGMALPGAG